MADATVEGRFWSKVNKDGPNGCWEWTAALDGGGYGKLYVQGKYLVAHRLSYEWLVGPIPQGFTIDHLCRNERCVNPEHLEPVTHRENLRRGSGYAGLNARKTHCPQGHPYAGDNLVRDAQGRRCRVCTNAKNRAAHHRRYAARKVEGHGRQGTVSQG